MHANKNERLNEQQQRQQTLLINTSGLRPPKTVGASHEVRVNVSE